MSTDGCIVCSKTVRPRQEALECEICKKWQHRCCNTGVSRDRYRKINRGEEQLNWNCEQCRTPLHESSLQIDESIHPIAESTANATSLEAESSSVHPVAENTVNATYLEAEGSTNNDSFQVERTFELPQPVTENSVVLDENLENVVVQEEAVTYDVVENGTKRGKRKLVDSLGYNYSLKKENGDKILWRCTKRQKTMNCPASVIQNGDNFKPGTKTHIHPSEPGIDIAVKIKAQELFKEATDIPIQLKLVTEDKMRRYQRKTVHQVQGKLFDLWDQYAQGDISTSRLLRKCAFIYGPTSD